MNQSMFNFFNHRAGDPGMVMARIGNQDSTGPIQPFVAPPVMDLYAGSMVPDYQGLAAHGPWFICPELLQQRKGFRNRYSCLYPSIFSINFGNCTRD